MKRPLKIGDRVRVTKISAVDLPYYKTTSWGEKLTEHPNGINPGYTVEGKLLNLPKIGDALRVSHSESRMLVTTRIVKMLGPNTVKTLNSIYEITPIESPTDETLDK